MNCTFCQTEIDKPAGVLNGMDMCQVCWLKILRENGSIRFNDLNKDKLNKMWNNQVGGDKSIHFMPEELLNQ